MRTRRFLASILTFLIMVTAFAPVCNAAAAVRVLFNEKYLDFDVPPIIVNDRTLAPLGEFLRSWVLKYIGIKKAGPLRLIRVIKPSYLK